MVLNLGFLNNMLLWADYKNFQKKTNYTLTKKLTSWSYRKLLTSSEKTLEG